ncbi:AmmeMemoRadiSam system protein A [Motiliproteus sediminis]|uniref:AmmeMemoRadiSam system protein A n=1 Tax=Motiliproteus sediminis TaxID=1468178 RepID=UPI001AF00A31|nr:AmmeMemoRadiSam system protein A [Motiliproteus sediminis]
MRSTDTLDPQQRGWLLAHARRAIAQRLQAATEPEAEPAPAGLDQPAACFVTLTRKGKLRGCIGTLEAQQPLADAVAHYAESAAFDDPRFPPLERQEWPDTEVELSVLSSPQPLAVASEADLLAQLKPHLHGLIIEHGHHRATFLPQVWEQLPEGRDFVRQLKRKAGLADEFPCERLNCSIYTVISIRR